MGKGVAVAVIILVAGGLLIGFPYYEEYLPFDIFEEKVEITTSYDGIGTVEGSGKYTVGTEFTLKAVPGEGYYFDHWDDGNKDSTRKLTAEENAKYVAYFAIGYNITLNSDTVGACSFIGAGGYPEGTKVIITVTEEYGYRFLEWNDGNTDTIRTFIMDSDIDLVAMFETLPYSTVVVNTNYKNGALITGDGKLVLGESRDLIVKPEYGYEFVGLYGKNGDLLSDTGTYNITAVKDGEIIYLDLKLYKGSYTLSTTSETKNSCTIVGAGEYYPTDIATIKVTMNEGYGFEGLYIDGKKVSETPTYSFTLTKDTNIVVKSKVLRDTSFTVDMSASEVPLKITINGKNNPDAISREWIVTNAITKEVVHRSTQRSFSFDVESGIALDIRQTITYPDEKIVSAKTDTVIAEETMVRSISWRYQDDTWTNLFGMINNASDNIEYTVKFSEYYNSFVNNTDYNKGSFGNCDKYVTSDDPLIKDLVKTFEDRTKDMSEVNRANYVLKFTQSFDYQTDLDSIYNMKEYWKLPYQTLFDMKGDCEDTAFLFASIMDALGYDCVILTVAIDGDNINHMAVGLNVDGASGTKCTTDGVDYYYCETAYTDVTGYSNNGNVGVTNGHAKIVTAYPF